MTELPRHIPTEKTLRQDVAQILLYLKERETDAGSDNSESGSSASVVIAAAAPTNKVMANRFDTNPDYLDGKTGGSLEVDASNKKVQLLNDEPVPGKFCIYGCDSTGKKGWIKLPVGALKYLIHIIAGGFEL